MDIPSAKDDDMPIDFQQRRTKAMLCPDEVRRLYFDEGLSQKQIAERAGWKTAHPVRRIFNEQGWIPRVQRGGVSPRHFRNDEERRHARSEHKKKSAQRIKDLREKLFGKECGLCGVSKEEKILPVHRKD